MSSLFNSFSKFSSKRENAIKEVLINTLIENSREIQYEVKQRGCGKYIYLWVGTYCMHICIIYDHYLPNVERLELCEATSTLCTTLEAIFLHGLKDSLLWNTINVIAGDEERRPEPSFWAPLLIFMHKQVIEQVIMCAIRYIFYVYFVNFYRSKRFPKSLVKSGSVGLGYASHSMNPFFPLT